MCDCDCGHHSPSSVYETLPGEPYIEVKDRRIAPLPKRIRLTMPPVQPLREHNGVTRHSHSARAESPDFDYESDGEEQRARDARAARAREAAATERRSAGDDDYGGHDVRAYEHWLAKRGELADGAHEPDRGTDESARTADSHDPASTESPPTSPASEAAAPPDPDALFGQEGSRIAKSLASASSFSPAGLYGGLGLATLHPSLSSPAHERHSEEPEEQDGDEDTYGAVDRSRPPVEPTEASQAAATALGVGGSNKKKRKIPGLNVAGTGVIDEDLPEGSSAKETSVRPSGLRSDFSSEHTTLKAPANPPTTAKAALAKLRIRPPHISLCTSCYSARRSHRKRARSTVLKHHPLPLPAAPQFVAPAMPRDGPPPLPPGSGLKGSKALKAAMKAHREREKEKDRVRKLFAHVRLPDLFDPEGKENPAPVVVSRAIKADLARRRAEGRPAAAKGDFSSAYPTPPGSSDEGDEGPDPASATHWTAGVPELDLFKFVERPSSLLEGRWTALNDQKERLKAAKERAAKAREEEKERRKEKEEKERAEAAAAAAAEQPVPAPAAAPTPAPAPAPANAPLPPTPAATPKRAPAPRAPAPPASTAAPPAPPPAAALPPPPPPPAAKPKKKGRKKRSAHANAHNVHHRDNYVPSRLPSQQNVHQASDGTSTPLLTSWPASDEAVAAAGAYASTCGGGHFCGPDEMLCLFCEYELFYGEEPLMLRAIRRRKNVLKVRKKAKDRASKATGGAAVAAPAPAPAAPVEGEAEPALAEEEYGEEGSVREGEEQEVA